MSNRPSQPAGSTLQPFRLLDLPRELLVPIVQSYRSLLYEVMVAGMYAGEEDEDEEPYLERYKVLRELCLTHRDILPFAQEELFKRLDIKSDESMDMLNGSIAGSERCKEYAGRTESIFVGWDVKADKVMESGAFNPRELHSCSPMRFSSLNRFQNLRRIQLDQARYDQALALPNLKEYHVFTLGLVRNRTAPALNSVDLPSLRDLFLQHHVSGAGSFGQFYDSVIPQLDHLNLFWIDETDLERLLLLSTSLQSLSCLYRTSSEGLTRVLTQIMGIDVKELHFERILDLDSSDNWETDYESIEKLKKLIAGKYELKQVKLNFTFDYQQRPSMDVCNRALARWKGIKQELELIRVKKGIEVMELTCKFRHDNTLLWEE